VNGPHGAKKTVHNGAERATDRKPDRRLSPLARAAPWTTGRWGADICGRVPLARLPQVRPTDL